MIVNTAYIYMGSGGGGTPANPNLWQDGVSNYPVEFKNSSISADGLKFKEAAGYATFSELPLTYFNGLTLSGSISAGGSLGAIEIEIEFYSSDNVLIGAKTAKISNSVNSIAVDIPSSAKIPNAKIKIVKTKNTIWPLTLSSAVLS